MTTQVCEAFVRISEACAGKHGVPMPKGVLSIGDQDKGWGVRLNTTSFELEGIQPFTAIVNWNGFPAGIIDPAGGALAAGEAANEETFLAWLATQPKPVL